MYDRWRWYGRNWVCPIWKNRRASRSPTCFTGSENNNHNDPSIGNVYVAVWPVGCIPNELTGIISMLCKLVVLVLTGDFYKKWPSFQVTSVEACYHVHPNLSVVDIIRFQRNVLMSHDQAIQWHQHCFTASVHNSWFSMERVSNPLHAYYHIKDSHACSFVVLFCVNLYVSASDLDVSVLPQHLWIV